MSDTTGWKKFGARTLYKNLPHCRMTIYYSAGAWCVSIVPNDSERTTKAEAQRLAHALARALEAVK